MRLVRTQRAEQIRDLADATAVAMAASGRVDEDNVALRERRERVDRGRPAVSRANRRAETGLAGR